MHPREFFGFKLPEVPFPRFLSNARKLGKENICADHFPDFNLESSTTIKNIFIMKNLTDFRKTVETGVDPRLRATNAVLADYIEINDLSAGCARNA